MPIENNPLTEDIVPLINAIAEDQKLQKWFFTLYGMPQNTRVSVLVQMEKKMTEKKKDAGFLHLLEELHDEMVFSAVIKTVKKMLKSEEN